MRNSPWLGAGIAMAAIPGCAADVATENPKGGPVAAAYGPVAAAYATVSDSLLGSDFEDGQIPFSGAENCTLQAGAAYSGGYGLRCDDTVTLTTMVPTRGYESLTLEYARGTARYDRGEALHVEVSSDNGSWATLETVTGSTDKNAVSFDLGAEYEQAGVVYVRFRAEANGVYEFFDLDDFYVRGGAMNVEPDAGVPDAGEPDSEVPCEDGVGEGCPEPDGIFRASALRRTGVRSTSGEGAAVAGPVL